ncbi:SUMF1/EgtB/PvdO family nonheme iron enzyme [uncultured Umboniibacter sp.]|uniref:SUMF1/EgtB/PvdO family nonheme iron enzyme n=1 Tax=uncultured Umboniibacter sp. TaxID=1798917 RepID=UPI0026020FF6|nr:SUMF1/EgtB/PvdO family nonheme iron enzyme [uncultured Umboniibacter sp.]
MKNKLSYPRLILTGISFLALFIIGTFSPSGTFTRFLPSGASYNSSDQQCSQISDELGLFVNVPGGGFTKAEYPVYPEEGSAHKVFVSPFQLQAHEVTNYQFARFVAETGYLTEAEQQRAGQDGQRGSARFRQPQPSNANSSWWQLDESVSWRSPNGIEDVLDQKGNHPVVHISLNDARAFASWAGGRIPTEVEWEYAASLGIFDANDPESGIVTPDGKPRANIWNGSFPASNTEEDGYAETAPVGCYQANLIGAYDMIGNVWEWTETQFSAANNEGAPRFTIKGGSYLCSNNHCRRFRKSARQPYEQDFSSSHIGFRIVRDTDSAIH